MKRVLPVIAFLVLFSTFVFGQSAPIIGALPFTLTNGTVADANQVMANFNYIVSQTNANAANAGVNANITSMTGLTTPISPSQGGSSVYYGGSSTNVGNAYVVSSPTPLGFTLTPGRTIVFIASATNTGASTINVNVTGVTNLYKQAATGPVAMSGGEIVNGAVVTAFYDGTQFQCTNCTAPSLVPTGTTVDFSGVNVPTGWLLANGTAQSRSTFPALFATLALTVSATTASSTSVTVPNSTLFQIGWYIGGSNVTCNSWITAIPDGTHITINAAAGATGATTLTIGPYQQGDCSTTFNLPNYTGKFTASVDGTTNITTTTCPNAASIGDKVATPNTGCGLQTTTIANGNLPAAIPYTEPNSAQGHQHGINLTNSGAGGTSLTLIPGAASNAGAQGTFLSNFVTTGIVINQGSANTPISRLAPTSLVYKIIKT